MEATNVTQTREVEVMEEPSAGQLVRRAHDDLAGGRLAEVELTLKRLLTNYPEHLEGWVLQAMFHEARGQAGEVTKDWARVERVLVYQGKVVPFELQQTLYEATRHYLRLEHQARSRLFLDELWRRFPTGEWAAKAQLLVAEIAVTSQRWSEVQEACKVLSRIRPDAAANQRCGELQRAARRMLQLGPEPDKDAQRWSWEHPQPQGNALNDIWVAPGKQLLIVAVGDAGTILQATHADRFVPVKSPTRWSLNALGGTDPSSLYAVGAAGVVILYDGSKWTVVRKASPSQPDLWGVFSAGRGHVVAVGDGGVVVQLRDGKWSTTRAATVTLRGVWGHDADHVLAVGEGGTMLAFAGGRWQPVRSDSYEDLWGIWGADKDHVIAVGNRKTVVNFDGKKAKEAIVGRYHFRDVWGAGTRQAWAVGTGGEIVRRANGSWRGERSGCLVDLYGVAGRSEREVWAVGDGGTILRRQGESWRLIAGGLQQKLVAVLPGPAAGEGHALGESGALVRRDRRGRWKVVDSLPLLGRYKDLWSDGRRWIAVGERGLMVVKNGKAWTQLRTDTPEDLAAVWGWDGGAVAVGTRGTVVRVVGDKVTRDMTPSGLDLHDVTGRGPRSLVAVGHRGSVIIYDGERWVEQSTGILADLYGVWSDPAGAVWAVGSAGAIISSSGHGSWKQHTSPISQTLVGVWGNASGTLFAISGKGAIIGYENGLWRVQSSPAACLTAVNGDPATGVLAVGCNGTVLRWTP